MEPKIHHIAGIGIGPFNLGFAALSNNLGMDTIFFDQSPAFDWHRGLMIEGSTLQVPFLADLVSSVDPMSRFSYVNYLVEVGRLFKFCIKESFYVTRKEYNDYCRWVAAQLPQLRFSHRVESIGYNGTYDAYEIGVHDLIRRSTKTYLARKLVLGTGTVPSVPAFAKEHTRERVFHSSQYIHRRRYIKPGSTIAIIGSGQSAAEIFQDLLGKMEANEYKLKWITEADRFFPMENSKLTFEHTSPDYLGFFHSLPEKKRHEIIFRQDSLYKGINQELIDTIYDQLYEMDLYADSPLPVRILPSTRLKALDGDKWRGFDMVLHHKLEERDFGLHADYVVLATGYRHQEPAIIKHIDGRINRDGNGKFAVASNFSIDTNGNEVYVLNAELASHGILTADLGMGPYRNAAIINDILGNQHYKLEERIAFQDFGVPKDLKPVSNHHLTAQP